MCEECLLENNDVDNLLEQYKQQQREVYINKTIPAIDRLEGAANRLADAYEMKYRASPTYENEERMRYWRYMGAAHWSSKSNYDPYMPAYSEYKRLKNEYNKLVRWHKRASKTYRWETLRKSYVRNKKNALIFVGLLGLSIGINVLVHILFALAS